MGNSESFLLILRCCPCNSNNVAEIEGTKKAKKLTSSEMRKKKKDRMARRKRGEEVFSDEDD